MRYEIVELTKLGSKKYKGNLDIAVEKIEYVDGEEYRF